MNLSTHFSGWSCWWLLLLGLAGCHNPSPARFEAHRYGVRQLPTTAVTNQVDSSLLRAPQELFRLGPGDRLELEWIEDAGSRTVTTVGPDGKIYFSLLPGLDVWGLTLGETKALIEREMAKFVRDQPQLSITLRGVESRQIWLLGRFQNPGVYPLPMPMTLLEAIAQAGGTLNISGTRDQAAGNFASDELADLRRNFVVRQGQLLPVDFKRLLQDGDLSQNIFLEAGDFVYMPALTSREVYVLGAVQQPRLVPFNEGMTLLTAIASAFGTVRDAHLSHVAIVRGSLTQPEIAVLDYNEIVRGRSPDVQLEPRDIVYVPYTPYRVLTRYLDIILTTFVSSVAINEGARAVARQDNGPAGITIPIGSRITVLPPPIIAP